jgi:predicted ATPase
VATIQTPDQRVRVFVSSTMKELAAERAAVREAIERLHLTPVLFELGARPHPPKELYLAYLRQSHVFLGIYGEQYGWIAPGETVSGLEDEYLASGDKPRLVYVKSPAPGRDPRLAQMLERIGTEGLSYRRFGTPDELAALVVDDLAVLLSERFGPPEAATEPVSAAGEPDWRLPAPPNRFIGREDEIEQLRRVLTSDGVRLVTLIGPGGIGKTRLALTVAGQLREDFPDGVVAVMLAAVTSPEHVPVEIARALGLPETFGRAPLEAIVAFLRSRRVLLLLDNFEQVIQASPAVTAVLGETTFLRVLVTSREVLHLTGERVFPVQPLPVGDPDGPVPSDAVELFLDRARAVRPDLAVDSGRLRVVHEICRRLDGLPLAIELAAARVRLLEPEVILQRLDRRMALLTGGPRDVARRQQALRATIEWSYDLLADCDRRLFRRLAIFSGGFFLDAAEAICQDDQVEDVLDGLTSLVDKSLVRVDPVETQEPHFAMLETVREYAHGCLLDSPELGRLEQAHTEFFERMALDSIVGFDVDGRGRPAERVMADADNLRAAMQRLLDQDEPDRVTAMGEGLWPLWWGGAHFDEGKQWMRAALQRPSLSPAGRAQALCLEGVLAFGQGDYDRGEPALQEAYALHRALGDEVRAVLDSLHLGAILAMRDPVEAERLERVAVDVLRERGQPWQYAFALFTLGRVLVVSGRHAEAVPLLEESVSLIHAPAPHPLLSYAVLNLGWARLGLDDLDGARAAFGRALAEAISGDEQAKARALDALAAVAVHDDPRLGALLFGAADHVRRVVGLHVWITDRPTHARTEAALREALGDLAFAEAVEEGTRYVWEDLYDLACAPVRSFAAATAERRSAI